MTVPGPRPGLGNRPAQTSLEKRRRPHATEAACDVSAIVSAERFKDQQFTAPVAVAMHNPGRFHGHGRMTTRLAVDGGYNGLARLLRKSRLELYDDLTMGTCNREGWIFLSPRSRCIQPGKLMHPYRNPDRLGTALARLRLMKARNSASPGRCRSQQTACEETTGCASPWWLVLHSSCATNSSSINNSFPGTDKTCTKFLNGNGHTDHVRIGRRHTLH